MRVQRAAVRQHDLMGDVEAESQIAGCRLLARLPSVDLWFSEKIARLKTEGKALRFAAGIDGIERTARVGAVEVPRDHPLAAIRGGENAFAFTTKYYSPIPLVIRGYGAGADVPGVLIVKSVSQPLSGSCTCGN